MAEWWRKLKALLRRDALDAELQEEIQSHLEMRVAELGNAHAARRRFGNPASILEDARSAWTWPRPEAWLRDLRYALRGMKRRPGFAATIVATLALGIAATVTIFSVVDTALIRPLAYDQPGRLVAVQEVTTTAERREAGLAPGRLEDWNRLSTSFENIAGSYTDTLTETSGSTPEQMTGAFVTPGFFEIFRTPALVGRFFSREEEQFGGPAVLVISHGLWQRRFAADPGVVGSTLALGDQSYTILGVMPPSFQYPTASTELWVPKQANQELLRIRQVRFYRFTVGRLKPAVTLDQARADLEAVQARLAEQYPETDAGWTARIEPLQERQTARFRLALWLLFGSAALLLLIACSNVASLLLAQFNARAEEVATRRAIGASRGTIARQLFSEGLAYALAGSSAGVLLAYAAVAAVRQRLPDLPRISELAVDWRVLAFAAAVGAAVATIVSLAPILQTLRRNEILVRGARGVVSRGQRLPRVLVSAQLALATVLLVGSGLFLQSLLRLQQTSLGFQPDRVLTFRISATFSERPAAAAERHARTIEALSSLPGVQSVAMSQGLPGTIVGPPMEVQIAGQENAADAGDRYASGRIVTAGYFQTLGIPFLSGQTCRMDPNSEQPFEAVVNRAFVDQFLQGRKPVGLDMTRGPATDARSLRIVGVVANTREAGYARAPEPLVYLCGLLRFWPDSEFLMQTRGAPATMTRAIREAIHAIEPARAVYAVSPLTEVLSETLSEDRFRAGLISAFSAIALILAGVGVYGVTAYMVSQRIREFGIRMALGARPTQIWAEILASGGRLAAIGAAIGVILASLASRLITSLLYGVEGFEAAAYFYAAAVLLAAALFACLVPGRRASSIDPAQVLREQ
jgi:predicted permease